MNPLMLYFVKSLLSLGIFYGAWFLFFRKQTDFRFNRYYLLLATLLSVFIPLIQLPALFPAGFQNPLGQLLTVQLGEIQVGDLGSAVAAGSAWSLVTILWDVYLLGVFIMALRFLFSLFRLYRLVRKSETKTEAGIKFVFVTEELPVFSFFHLIFIRKAIFENPRAAAIICHEKIHIRQKHSLDLIWLEILGIFQWFNPFVYLIKKAVKENHEFIADRDLTVSESSENSYLHLLFSEAGGFEFSPITHNFSYLLLKKRMIMMKNQKSPQKMPVKLLFTACAIALTLFACSNADQPVPDNSPQVAVVTQDKKIVIRDQTPAEQNAIAAQADTGQVFQVVEKMPQFPGGLKALMQYLADNITYPAEAKKAGVEGRVFVNFIVEKDGSISHFKILRSIGTGAAREAINHEVLKALMGMPHWIPGYQHGKPVRVSFNLPVKFSLQ
ncbi:M56 family metallopeptidase [Candidatus Sulfidibacterium hydrothermale]|uniref:M56 family metallopeptidase n=1 Tax=Candidatus Sulfidibacterium hydrothermale TaxID=2875962 RepID=UPI001F0A4646|nr:M56 family metallopeptidase [Candidatus Sulfidibacterium hydrothermale]UBM62088.1 M56 family metallopeptidase [Candidatus Sulfidibacterium hydrothermale]